MQFITSLFGAPDNAILNSAFALGIVLVLIVLGLWALKAFSRAGQNLGRGGRRRLTIVDSAMVDGKRQVIIIRRDNVEHLIMTGGPQDLVIESGVPAPEPPAPRRARTAGARATRPQPKPQAASVPAPELATPPVAAHNVSRDTVDRLRDLARPLPLKPRSSLRNTGLMREEQRAAAPVIPMAPSLRVEKLPGPSSDSATTATGDSGGHPRFASRKRFFGSLPRDERS